MRGESEGCSLSSFPNGLGAEQRESDVQQAWQAD
jgi:hypothetical protein